MNGFYLPCVDGGPATLRNSWTGQGAWVMPDRVIEYPEGKDLGRIRQRTIEFNQALKGSPTQFKGKLEPLNHRIPNELGFRLFHCPVELSQCIFQRFEADSTGRGRGHYFSIITLSPDSNRTSARKHD